MAEKIGRLYEEMKEMFEDVLSSRYHRKAVDFVFTNPMFRNKRFSRDSGIPAASAACFTLLLDKNLIVTKEEAAGHRTALYSFEPLMELVRV